MYFKEMDMHTADILALLPKELDRLKVIARYKDGNITQVEAARLLGLSERHLRRLIRRTEHRGDTGVQNRRRGKAPSNRLSEEIKTKALTLIQEHFYDYGPTLAAEKLKEYFQLSISKETVRQWMIEAHFWQAHTKKIPKPHPPRARREFLGELIQIDGSYHRWFENRGPKCCLLVFIDDATSRIMNLRLCVAETTIDYLSAFKEYVVEYGVPRAVYFDKHNVFHINQRAAKSQDGVTQFGRVLKTLGIKPIYAHSPQAKGRVERANETLQDRLIKEFRFHKINDINQANLFLKGFIERYNQRFEKKAMLEDNVHRQLSPKEAEGLNFLFSIHSVKKISKDLLIRHNKQLIKIIPPKNRSRQYVNQKVTICESLNSMLLYCHGKQLNFTIEKANPLSGPTLSRKTLDHYLDQEFIEKKYWSLTS